MHTKVTISDSLFANASAVYGLPEDGPLFHAALHALILREAALRLATLTASQRNTYYGAHRPEFDL